MFILNLYGVIVFSCLTFILGYGSWLNRLWYIYIRECTVALKVFTGEHLLTHITRQAQNYIHSMSSSYMEM